jgi:AraC-like DNA-binding protein
LSFCATINKFAGIFKEPPSLDPSAFLPFTNLLHQIGAPVERRLAEFVIPSSVLHDPESLLPLVPAFRFLERNAMAEGLTDLGLLAAQNVHIRGLGAFGQLVMQSATLYSALRLIARLIPLYNSAQRIWLEPWQGKSRICYHYARLTGASRKYGHQFTFMLVMDLVRNFAGPRWVPSEIHIERGVDNRQLFERFGAAVYERDISAIVLDPALLGKPPWRPSGNGHAISEHAFAATAPAGDFLASVKQVIRLYIRDNMFAIEPIAAIVGTSPRTLQRRLAEQGAEFSELVSRARLDEAMRLLADEKIQITDIAHELGYSDTANFTRAFRRWTGVAPSLFRAQFDTG